jgi:NADH-quinone oxidoreductase subunit C
VSVNTTALPSEEKLLPQVRNLLGDKVRETHCHRGDETIVVDAADIVDVLGKLRADKDLDFEILMDLCGVDYKPRRPRYEVVYHLVSYEKRHRLRVKVKVDGPDARVPTVSHLWPGANWFEREAWDMYGIVFDGHPDLRRLLMYEQFEGHPLRKDYPVTKRQPLVGPRN